jgi:hypothetical protein
MAEKDKPLTKIAQSSPGLATAAAQKGVPKKEVSQIAALVELRNMHNELTSLPQADAYKKYQTMDKTTRDALASMFDPKYSKEDKGFIGSILNSVKSSVYYGGGTTVDIVKNLSTLNPMGAVSGIGRGAIGAVKGLFSEAAESEAGKAVAGPVEKGLELLVRPQEKLVKQPYIAAQLAVAEGEDALSSFGRYAVEGFKELLPGGEDAKPEDNTTAFMSYWAKASEPSNVFDEKAVASFNNDLTPAASYLGRLLASKQDLVENFEQYQDNPGVIELVNRYVSGDEEALKEVADSVARFEKSKISPGRDVARAIISVLPHEYEKAVLGDGKSKALFTAISAPVDFGVTFGLDPLIIGGKVRRGLLVAKYGFFKVGEGTISIEKAFQTRKVRAYWDEAGQLIERYRNGDLVEKATALNRLQDRFPEININVVDDLAKADVRNAEDALVFFDNGQRFVDMMSGNIGLAGRDTLIPRMTFARGVSNEVKDLVARTLGTERFSSLNIGKTDKEFIAQFSDDPAVWTEKIGLEKTGVIYTAKDKSILAKIDRAVRLFSIAPKQDRIISIADASSANQIFKLARTVLDKTSAGAFRAAWIGASEGERLLMYKGLLKTLGVGMGLNLSNEGRLALSKIDEMSKEIYSPSQSALDIGDLADVLRTAPGAGGKLMPRGVRKQTQEALNAVTAEGKAGRLLASINAKIAEYIERSKALKADRADALAAGDVDRAEAIADEIKIVGMKLGREMKSKKELKGKMGGDTTLAEVENLAKPAVSKSTPKLPKNYSVVRADNPQAVGLANLNVIKDGQVVGSINWNVDTKVIENIEIVASERGKNIAQAIWAEAKKIEPELKHSEFRTPSGDKFAYSTGDVVPPLNPIGDTWTTEKLAEANARASQRNIDDVAKSQADDELSGIDLMSIDRFNAGQTVDGTPRGIRLYQLDDYRSLPDFSEWREIAQRAGVFTELFGRVTNNHYSKNLADGWSFLNLYPRLGLRSSVEEVGMYGMIGGADGFAGYLHARAASRAIRAASKPGVKTTVFGNEKSDRNLGFIYDTIFKITNRHYSEEQLLAMAADPELLGRAVADSMIKNRFRPEFLQTRAGLDIAKWSGDFAEFNGKAIMDDINGASVRAERPITEAEEISNSLKQFGPSVRFNVQNQEALKGMTFKPEFTEISYTNEKFVFNWLLELNNTVGKRNGQFGNIVLWNAGKKPQQVIDKLVEYIEGPGNDIAKRFAIYAEEGAEALARNIYLDATYPLRDFAGRLNMDLVNAIRNKGGMDDFKLEDLVKLDKPYARPEAILGREIVPIGAPNAEQVMYRVINSGYGWMGKQIALLDREPITLANYFMFRKQLQGTEAATKKSLMDNGLSEEGADSIARFSAHENALNLARTRTLGFVDNGDVRTNLAYSLRTLGRYYRATEDFYRRLSRLGKYEKRGIVRLAIVNQTFEDSGFIHQDDRGQKYFTYPGDDLFAGAIIKTLALAGITSYTPMPVNFGGYVKMLTPSLDPESWKPGLSNPLASLAIDAFTNIPYVGEYITGVRGGINYEKLITGAYSTDVPAWEKAAPANVKRVVNLFGGSVEGTESRFSSAVKAVKLLVSTGNGPTNSSQLESFFENIATQAKNIDIVKFIMGQTTIASIQSFDNNNVPKELINAGVFTWDSEFQKIMKKFDGDPNALSKALVQFAKLYPSKLAYTNFATESTTYASFRKTIEAEEFVRKNEKLLLEHSDAGSFFIPAGGTADINSYNYLKKKGYISNKPIDPRVEKGKENFIRQVATTGARQAYYALNDDYNAKIAAAQSMNERRYWRQELAIRKKGLLAAYPLLGVQVSPTAESNARRIEVIDDMKSLLKSGKAPNKELGNTFIAMLAEYDKMESTLKRVVGSSDKADEFKRNLRADTKDILFQLSRNNENAATFFNSVLDPLIGE